MEFFEYTPALQKPETLATTLVGRDIEIKQINRILKSAGAGRSFSHPLFIGPKGIGKSHLLQCIYHAVKGNTKIRGITQQGKKFITVIFPEEEYVDDITQFTAAIVRYLPESEKKAFTGVDELAALSLPDERAQEIAVSFLESFKEKTGKTLLLLVDNLNDILEGFTDEDQSILRRILMASDSVLLIGAAPTLFDSVINHDKPLYNFFEVMWLRELSFDDCRDLLKGYAKLEKRDDLVKEIETLGAKLRAIHELTGGNPRLMLRLYHIISEGDIASVETSLLKLLDGLSPYFRERIKDLSAQQRKIIDVMARSELLLTPTEIGPRCHLPVNIVNSQMKRLEQAGYVKKARQQKKRRVLYEINERLFCLWRQMRVEAGRKRLGFIVRFLEIWYTKEELRSTLDNTLADIHKKFSRDYDGVQTCLDTLWYVKEAIPELKHRFQTYGFLFLAEGLKGNIESAVKNLKKLLTLLKHSKQREMIHDFFITSLKAIVKKNRPDFLKITLQEIEASGQTDLMEPLTPFSRLISYLETGDREIIERLRKEDRQIMEEMLNELGKKVNS